jgi:tetrapyrrole methylase family protein / MazG family protein
VITVIGLGPGDLDRVPSTARDILLDPTRAVIVRTIRHPAAARLASLRSVTSCDDLYERDSYPEVYRAIVERVLDEATRGPVVYAVPGSPLVGELAVRELEARTSDIEVIPAESFVDAILAKVGYDPLDRGLQILNGHQLPSPLVLDKPTIIGHLDRPEVLSDVAVAISRVLPDDAIVTVFKDVGAEGSATVATTPDGVDPDLAGDTTSLFIDTEPGGLIGVVRTMRRLRDECPWDREQTHQSLVKNLIEETYELIEVISALPDGDPDWVAYAAVEDELGDVLLQVLFHTSIAREWGAFDIDDVAEVLRQKLVRRHPHVFGEVEAGTPAEVKQRWDRIKQEERGGTEPESALSGVPTGMPALHRASKIQNRAAKVGFDWDQPSQVVEKVIEEVEELRKAIDGSGEIVWELGDLLFSVVNLARHLGVDTEVSLQRATDRFVERFRRMEDEGPLDGLGLDGLNRRWERAKQG